MSFLLFISRFLGGGGMCFYFLFKFNLSVFLN